MQVDSPIARKPVYRSVYRPVTDQFSHQPCDDAGRGVPHIVEAYGRDSYEFRDGSIALTIPFNRIDAVRLVSQSPVAKAPVNLNRTQRRVPEEIRNDPNATYDQPAAAVGRGKSTVNGAVRLLKELGYIERVGSDKSGRWRVL